LGDHHIGVFVDIRSCETQDPIADEQILAAIVLDQALPMVTTVELDNKPRFGVVEVGPACEMAPAIPEVGLDLWLRQTGLNQKPPKASFHRRLRRRRQRDERSHSSSAVLTLCSIGVPMQSSGVGQTEIERHVDGDQRLDRKTFMT
jgi:hypothetical protein